MAKYVNVERQIGLKTAFAHLFDHDSSCQEDRKSKGLRSGVAAHGLRMGGARRGSGGRDSPNGAYRSEGPCRHNMLQILLILKVVFGDKKI